MKKSYPTDLSDGGVRDRSRDFLLHLVFDLFVVMPVGVDDTQEAMSGRLLVGHLEPMTAGLEGVGDDRLLDLAGLAGSVDSIPHVRWSSVCV